MKAILEFDLDDADDAEAHKLAMNASSYKNIIEDFTRLLKSYNDNHSHLPSLNKQLERQKDIIDITYNDPRQIFVNGGTFGAHLVLSDVSDAWQQLIDIYID